MTKQCKQGFSIQGSQIQGKGNQKSFSSAQLIRIRSHSLFTTGSFSLFQRSHAEAKTWRGWSRTRWRGLGSSAMSAALPPGTGARMDNCYREIPCSFSSAMRSLRNQVMHLRQNLICLLNVNQTSPLLTQRGLPYDGTLVEFYRHINTWWNPSAEGPCQRNFRKCMSSVGNGQKPLSSTGAQGYVGRVQSGPPSPVQTF